MTMTTLWVLAAIVTVANIVLALFGSAGPFAAIDESTTTLIADLLPAAVSFIAVWCLLGVVRVLKKWESLKVSWTAIALGILLAALAEWSYSFMEVVMKMDMDNYFPSPADFFWLTSYLFILAGLAIMFLTYRRSGLGLGRTAYHVVMAGGVLVTIAAVVKLLIMPILADPEMSGLQKGVLAAYPILDLVVLGPSIALAYVASLFGGGRVARPWRLLTAGFCLWTISDIIYSYLELTGHYTSGHPIDLGWNLSYLLIAMGALLQRDLLTSFNAGAANV